MELEAERRAGAKSLERAASPAPSFCTLEGERSARVFATTIAPPALRIRTIERGAFFFSRESHSAGGGAGVGRQRSLLGRFARLDEEEEEDDDDDDAKSRLISLYRARFSAASNARRPPNAARLSRERLDTTSGVCRRRRRRRRRRLLQWGSGQFGAEDLPRDLGKAREREPVLLCGDLGATCVRLEPQRILKKKRKKRSFF